MPLSDYSLSNFTAGPYTRPVYRRGSGPAVIIIHEVPALHTLVIDFADRLAASGMTVICPSLFGTPGSVPTKAAAVKQLFLNICIIPTLTDIHPCAHWRSPMDMMRQG